MKIEFTLPANVPSSEWRRIAEKRARDTAREAGVDYKACEVFVKLPESGRCFRKDKGFVSLGAYG